MCEEGKRRVYGAEGLHRGLDAMNGRAYGLMQGLTTQRRGRDRHSCRLGKRGKAKEGEVFFFKQKTAYEMSWAKCDAVSPRPPDGSGVTRNAINT